MNTKKDYNEEKEKAEKKGEGRPETGEGRRETEKVYIPPLVVEATRFSLFRCPVTNTYPSRQITLLEAFHLIRGDAYRERTLELRSICEPEAAGQYKRKYFDYVTFSGVFSKRSDAALVSHSGLMVLDFDHVENMALAKQALVNDPGSVLDIDMMFVSPSGHGLKCVISIDVVKLPHKMWFETVALFLKQRYHLELDRSGKDVSRACFLCHDPEAWIHPNYTN